MADIIVIDKTTPLQIAVDPVTGDIVDQVGNKLVFNQITARTAVAQTGQTRLQSFLTEFFLDVTYGVDWFGIVFNQGAQPVEQEAELNDMLRDTNGVNSLQASEILRNSLTREATYLAQVLSDGQIIPIVLPFDFIEPSEPV